MSNVVKIALRVLVVAAILTVIPLVPSAPTGSPYVSSLSNVTVGAAFASQTCENKGCNGPASCGHNKNFNCINPGAPTHCVTAAC